MNTLGKMMATGERPFRLATKLPSCFVLATCALLLGFKGAYAQNYTNLNSVIDGGGRLCSGGLYTNISACAQPGGITAAISGSYVNYAGFMGGFSLQPWLDTDGDGLANEADADNDDDGLFDLAELTGSEFTPVTYTNPNDADSDDDGVSDYAESVAATHPLDDSMYLHITDFAVLGHPADEVAIVWQGRDGRLDQVCAVTCLVSGVEQVLGEIRPSGGSPPWYEVYPAYTNPVSGTTNMFFYIKTGGS